MRGRKVYDVIELISEVSGLADIFFLFVSVIIGFFYVPFLLQSALLEHMGPCVQSKPTKTTLRPPSTDKRGIQQLLNEVRSRFTLKLSVWLLMLCKVVPRRCRSTRTNKLFDLADKSLRRIEDALDVKKIVEN